ncbi:galanin receptor type 2-like [Patiria miniata]|uniref:G-protein coupled receptors family 1 profile domain-containing protein n=1 Tax=Patiria miniata TaxID=46514 RepID=A0A914BIG7_PATMI|nr:galanin receptor type 2-like [Patiria miniata]
MSGTEPTSSWGWEVGITGAAVSDATARDDDSAGGLPEGQQHWEVPFLTTVSVFGVLGNLVVLVVYSSKAFRRSNSALYILNLAAGDLFLLLLVVPLHVTEYYPATWPLLWRHDAQCVLHRYARFVGFNLTTFTALAISVDRYLAVCHPLVYRARCTRARTRLCILLVWGLAAATAAPCAINFGVKYEVGEYTVNFVGKTPFACRTIFIGSFYQNFKVIYVSVVLFWVPVLATAITYTAVVGYVWRNNKKFRQCTSAGRHLRSHWKAARTLLLVFGVYVATYVFLATYTLVRQYATADVSPLVKNVGLLLPYANCCLNPVVYSLVNVSFRRSCMQIFCPGNRTKGGAGGSSSNNAGKGESVSGQQASASVGQGGIERDSQAGVADDEEPVGSSDVNDVGQDHAYGFDNQAYDEGKVDHYHGFDSVM